MLTISNLLLSWASAERKGMGRMGILVRMISSSIVFVDISQDFENFIGWV